MELLGGLTTTDQIRAVLTVSSADLPDPVLEGYGLEDDLAEDLSKWVPTWEGFEAGGRQQRLLRLYAKYFCASIVAVTAQAFILKKMTDGSNEGGRSDIDGWESLPHKLRAKAETHRGTLANLLDPTRRVAMPTLISGVAPARDVIVEGRG